MVGDIEKRKLVINKDVSYYKKKVNNNFYLKHVKRLLDIIITPVLILFSSPVLILTAILIKLTSKGPILFKQPRIGYQKKNFTCYKFRSMYYHTKDHNNPDHLEKDGILFKDKNDPRVTFIGKLIRRSSIDELPQLFNILKGEMSLVGPRPHLEFMAAPYPKFRTIRTLVLPGLSGYWQIKNRANNTSVLDMVDYDLYYLEHASFWLDIKIILHTATAVIKAHGAY